MQELTLEALAKRVEELERKVAQLSMPIKDWRGALGMFDDSEFMRQVDEKGRKIRQADREEARTEFGE